MLSYIGNNTYLFPDPFIVLLCFMIYELSLRDSNTADGFVILGIIFLNLLLPGTFSYDFFKSILVLYNH